MSNVPLFYPNNGSDKAEWEKLNAAPVPSLFAKHRAVVINRMHLGRRHATQRADFGRFKPHIWFENGRWRAARYPAMPVIDDFNQRALMFMKRTLREARNGAQ